MQESNIKQDNHRTKTFVFQKEETQQSVIINESIDIDQDFIDLTILLNKYAPIETNKISIYDPNANRFVNLSKISEKKGLVPRGFLEIEVILIRFKNIEDQSGIQSQSYDSSFEQKDKKDRSKQRTIGEVIEVVRQWRSLHLNGGKNGFKKMNLQDAAKAVGISKKSLDDYYYQLRLGEFYKFDFGAHLQEKVGVLRTFVKEFKPEKEKFHDGKLQPHTPQILPQQFQDIKLKKVTSSNSFNMEVEQPESSWQNFENPFAKELINSYQNQFYKNFEFLLDDPNDPFLSIDRDFRKKDSEQFSDQFFF